MLALVFYITFLQWSDLLALLIQGAIVVIYLVCKTLIWDHDYKERGLREEENPCIIY